MQQSVILIGTNDLGSMTAAETIANLDAIAALVPNPHFVTILPFGNAADWTAPKEAKRQTINANIRARAGSADVESAMADLTNPAQPVLKASYDFGDGRHLNHAAGDPALAAAIFASRAFVSTPLV